MDNKKLAAILFAFFLGGIGAHKFYVGDVLMGIFYLLFCLTFIPSILGVIDAILFIGMYDDEFKVKYPKLYMGLKKV
jgi:TM2 domain containing protein+B7201